MSDQLVPWVVEKLGPGRYAVKCGRHGPTLIFKLDRDAWRFVQASNRMIEERP